MHAYSSNFETIKYLRRVEKQMSRIEKKLDGGGGAGVGVGNIGGNRDRKGEIRTRIFDEKWRLDGGRHGGNEKATTL